jgi:hypothetical protein
MVDCERKIGSMTYRIRQADGMFVGQNGGTAVRPKYAARFPELSQAIARAKALFGPNWNDHAAIEPTRKQDFLQPVSKDPSTAKKAAHKSWRNGLTPGRRKQLANLYSQKHPRVWTTGKIKGETFYIYSPSKLRSAEMLGEIGLPKQYWTLYRHFKTVRKNLPFKFGRKPTEGIWKEIEGDWKKVL